MDTNYDPWCYIEDKRFYRLLINLLQHHIDLNLTTVFRDLRANLHEHVLATKKPSLKLQIYVTED